MVRTVPDCPLCGNLLGLYYADCMHCYRHARDFTMADYDEAKELRKRVSE